jgi:pilus assembly protein Flp/PilA
MDLKSLRSHVERFTADASGATAIEYGLIALGIAVAIIASVQLIGGDVSNIFVAVGAGFP